MATKVLIPDPKTRNSSGKYLRRLIGQTQLSQEQVAEALGVTVRTLRRWINFEDKRPVPAPYLAQFAIEVLVANIKEYREANGLVVYKGKTMSIEAKELLLKRKALKEGKGE